MRLPLAPRVLAIAFGIVMTVVAFSAAQDTSGDSYVGQWTGTYEGAATGTFELLLRKETDAKLGGKVSVTTDGGNYDAELRSITIQDKKIDAAYDFPLDPSAEVIMAATVDGANAKGTWSLRPKGGGAEVAGGTISLTRK
jgi:hypothetical protein